MHANDWFRVLNRVVGMMMREVDLVERNKRLTGEVEELREDLQELLTRQSKEDVELVDSPDEVKLTRIEYEELKNCRAATEARDNDGDKGSLRRRVNASATKED